VSFLNAKGKKIGPKEKAMIILGGI